MTNRIESMRIVNLNALLESLDDESFPVECAAMTSWSRSTGAVRRWFGLLAAVLSLTAAAADDGVGAGSRRRPGGLHYAVREELRVGTRVADVVADARLHRHGAAALRTMRFRLLNQPRGGLVVDETTGVLSVGSRLDREQLCPGVDEQLCPGVDRQLCPGVDEQLCPGVDDLCQIRLDVAVQPMTYFQIIKVKLPPNISRKLSFSGQLTWEIIRQ